MKNVGYNSPDAKRPLRQSAFFLAQRSCGFVLMLALLAGCSPMYTKPVEREPATQAERNFRDLWNASCETLKRYGYSIDRQDRRDGVITTYAVSGGHGLEALWRKDASNFFYFRENTAQNILRAVRVTVRRLPDHPDEFDFKVEVRMARSNRSQPQLTDTVQVNSMNVSRLPELRFSDLEMRHLHRGEKLQGLRAHIVPLGDDEELAWRIDRAIRAKSGVRDWSITESEENGEGKLPDMTAGQEHRTVILAGPLEEPESVEPASPPSAPAATPPAAKAKPFDETSSQTPHGQEKNHLLCSLRTAAPADQSTTPVSMIFRLRNVGDAPIRLPQPKHGMTMFGRYRKVGDTPWDGAPPPDSLELPRIAEIAPGETLDVPVTFGFGSAGEYEIYFRYSARPGRDTNWSGDLDSNVLKLNITGAK